MHPLSRTALVHSIQIHVNANEINCESFSKSWLKHIWPWYVLSELKKFYQTGWENVHAAFQILFDFKAYYDEDVERPLKLMADGKGKSAISHITKSVRKEEELIELRTENELLEMNFGE